MIGAGSAAEPGSAGTARRTIRVGFLVSAACGFGTPLVAQEDFRSTDLGHPILVEDAFPIKFREWEIEMGLRGDLDENGSGIDGILELKTGLFLNGQAGLEIEAGAGQHGGGSGSIGGVETVRGHVFYSISRETWKMPAVAARVDLTSPGTGSLGHEDWGIGFKGIATRSFGRLRMHSNSGYVAASADDGSAFWQLGLAFDYPVGLFSKAVMGDVYLELPVNAGRARVWAELGMRWQLSNQNVLDFGIASRLDEWEAGNANLQLILGLSRAFGLAGQVSVPPYPNPRID